jgi:anion-transporting  ArsA/GET3 family ATPase
MTTESHTDLDELFEDQKILICVGSGGVGKTTTSAALALRAAQQGLRSIVVTVDPARRLANALGMHKMPERAVKVDLGQDAEGTMEALMFDAQVTFDEVVRKHAQSPKERDLILKNPFYKTASKSLSGAHEYMAMERLLMLHESGQYDLIVLDTPPSVHALDLLKAPDKLLNFLESTAGKTFVRAAKSMGGRLGLFRLSGIMARGVSRFIGSDFFSDLLSFIQNFEGMYPGFRERAGRVKRLLRSKSTGFVVVHAPEEATLREAYRFDAELKKENMNVKGFVANKVHISAQFDPDEAQPVLETLSQDHPALALYDIKVRKRITKKIKGLNQKLEFLAEQDSAALKEIGDRAQAHTPAVPVYLVPHFIQDLHDVDGLDRFARSATQG